MVVMVVLVVLVVVVAVPAVRLFGLLQLHLRKQNSFLLIWYQYLQQFTL
jgi:hypothetical protein